MGLFDIFRRTQAVSSYAAPAAVGLVTPHESAALSRIAWSEHFQGATGEVNRNGAMRIPALAKARNVLAGIIASLPLVELEGETRVDQPWLYRTSGDVSPWHRLAWTVDDLFHHGWSMWTVKRDAAGQIEDAARVPFEVWSVNSTTGEITVDGVPAKANEVILIPGSFEGILEAGADTIRGAHALQKAWIGRAQNPIPLVELHEIGDDELEDDEIDEMLADWSAARTSPTGAVGFTDHRVELRVHGAVSTDLFEEGRNAIVLDIARLTALPAALLDGSMSSATLTYSTQEGKRNEFIDYTLPTWLRPIEARLSMDDVCDPGRRIRFDLSSLTETETPEISDPVED
ncbi:phage portal protein [Leucobacter chironomi]|uniref:phage portal protein n=1 Tax=Leucobacter chironomi TaxID=491918 RepID=UPI000462CEFE|nr:phage portal protein [Leucobacter chironomi]